MSAQCSPFPASLAAPPSRYDNPFATCWTRPGALDFRFAEGDSADQLIARLATNGWRGAIVGPHGSGKSTLLHTLNPALRAAGCRVRTVSLRDKQGYLPRGSFAFDVVGDACDTTRPLPSKYHRTLLIVDGYEQLGWLERWRLEWHCRRANLGLLVTSHAPTRIPTLIHLEPDARLLQQLVAELTTDLSTQVVPRHVTASHACHGSNVREILFDLYDLHERLRLRGRTRDPDRA